MTKSNNNIGKTIKDIVWILYVFSAIVINFLVIWVFFKMPNLGSFIAIFIMNIFLGLFFSPCYILGVMLDYLYKQTVNSYKTVKLLEDIEYNTRGYIDEE